MRIGFVIRTLNESELIGRCLETIDGQRGDFVVDVVVVDSGSTDATVDIARANGARVVELSPDEFDYSKALNVGIRAASGDVVVSLSAHAIPTHEDWLERMTAPFADARVAGVASRQVPWPGAPWQEVHRLEHQFPEEHRVYDDPGDPIVFSNAASAIRRSAWLEHPFTLPAAEDYDWAKRVVGAGWSVVYEPGASVFHSHKESARAQALRMIDLHRVLDTDRTSRTLRRTLREAVGVFFRDARKIAQLADPWPRKVGYLFELLQMVTYYVIDFTSAGSTAERRRGVSKSAGDSEARVS
jgi:glycosyltransferase involved in cell wall biosynthesis